MLLLYNFCNSCRNTNTLNTHEEIQQEAQYHIDNGNKISPLWWWIYFKLPAVLTVNPLSMCPFPCNNTSRFVCSQQQRSSFLASCTCCNNTNRSDLNESQSNSFFSLIQDIALFSVKFESYDFQVIIPDSIFKILILFWTQDIYWDFLIPMSKFDFYDRQFSIFLPSNI